MGWGHPQAHRGPVGECIPGICDQIGELGSEGTLLRWVGGTHVSSEGMGVWPPAWATGLSVGLGGAGPLCEGGAGPVAGGEVGA